MSVNSAEHMARLAVEALKVAGQRGVIVGGWADLSATSLGSGPEARQGGGGGIRASRARMHDPQWDSVTRVVRIRFRMLSIVCRVGPLLSL